MPVSVVLPHLARFERPVDRDDGLMPANDTTAEEKLSPAASASLIVVVR